jgi:hypothetical protein
MNQETTDAKRARKGRWRLMAGVGFGVVLAGGMIFVALVPRDPMFHGKRESEWLTNIVSGMSLSEDQNKQQIQQWHDFGPEGLRALERGLAPNRAPKYRNIYDRLAKFLPRGLMRLLPAPPPKTVGGTRAIVVDLLCRMGTNAHAAWPAVARALSDEDPLVQSRAITYFTRVETQNEDDKALLNQLPAKEKHKLLSQFISAVEYGGWCWNVRNNAALALKYYPEEASLVASPLVKALKDASPYVRLSAADALNRVDAAAGSKAGAVTVVARELQNPEYQLADGAAYALRQFQTDADAAVAALIGALEGTNRSVVGASAVWSLEWAFPDHTNRTIPALKKAAETQDNAGNYARSAVQALESGRRVVRRQ